MRVAFEGLMQAALPTRIREIFDQLRGEPVTNTSR